MDLAIVSAMVIAALVVALAMRIQTGGAIASDFPMEVYAGEAVIGGPSVDLYAVLDQDKPVVLNFWAGLCPPCRAEMPAFQRLYDEYGDKFIMLGVDVGPYVGLGTRQDALDFLEEFGITYPTARSLTFQPLEDYGVHGMPTTVFIGSNGDIFSSHVGLLPERDAERELLRLLQSSREGS